MAGRTVENESLVNFPNWLALALAIDGGDWFDLRTVTILSYRQELDLRRGVLVRTIRFEDPAGRRSTLVARRIVSMAEMHLAGLELTFTAENWSGRLTVRSGIDGRVVNDGARLYRKFNKQHLEPVTSGSAGKDGVYLHVRTSQSNLQVAQAARMRAYVGENLIESERRFDR
mgnify:FL=1